MTERRYFDELRFSLESGLIHVQSLGVGQDPEHVVGVAASRKGDFDETWCVVDVDTHTTLPQAKRLARDHGIRLVVSNPCFELWLLLHLQDVSGHRVTAWVQEKLRERVPEYHPRHNKHVPFDVIWHGHVDACHRAERLRAASSCQGSPHEEVWTNVDELTQRLLQFARPE